MSIFVLEKIIGRIGFQIRISDNKVTLCYCSPSIIHSRYDSCAIKIIYRFYSASETP